METVNSNVRKVVMMETKHENDHEERRSDDGSEDSAINVQETDDTRSSPDNDETMSSVAPGSVADRERRKVSWSLIG